MRGSFVLPGGVGFCNAIRRTLLSDVHGWAADKVTVHANTSCHTDEFLAHRIGLVPIRPTTGSGDEMTLDATGPCTVRAADLRSVGYEPVHGAIELTVLGEGQRLCVTVHVARRPARVHARFSPCAAVAMRAVDADRCQVTFETNDGRPPAALLAEALDAFDARVDRALHALANQPVAPPRSYC